jgi:hypothetical protein
MSLGGFAQGLATAFQRAEDRYQDEKARKEARAERKLAMSMQNAFTEKMYDRRQRDEHKKELRDTFNYLQSTFGTDEEGKRLTAAFLPLGGSAKDVISQYQSSVKGTGIDFRSLLEVSNPEGATENYQLPKFDAIMKQLQDQRFGKAETASGFLLPTVKMGALPSPMPEITGLEKLGSDDPFEAMINIDLAIKQAKANIEVGTPNVKKSNQAKLKVLEQLYEAEKKKAGNLAGTGELEKASMYTLVNKTIADYTNDNVLKKYMVDDPSRAGQRMLKVEGNVANILDSYALAYKGKDNLLRTFKINRTVDNAMHDRFNTNFVSPQRTFLESSINNITQNAKRREKSFVQIDQRLSYDQQRKAFKKVKRGAVVQLIDENGQILPPQMVQFANPDGRNMNFFQPLDFVSRSTGTTN